MTCNRRADSWSAKGLERAAPRLALFGLATKDTLPRTPTGFAGRRLGRARPLREPVGKDGCTRAEPGRLQVWERSPENKLGQI